jgi:hypothetical protein
MCQFKNSMLLWLLFLGGSAFAQQINRTDYTFDINQNINGTDYYYYFNKGKNDTFINLKIMTFNTDSTPNTLCKEVAVLEKFYNIAAKEIKIDLWNMNVGYPLQYEDVLANQINLFVKDSAWQNYYKSYSTAMRKEYTALDYTLISKLMTEGKVYQCLETELNKTGYTIAQVGIEKVGFLDFKYYTKLKSKIMKQFPYSESQLKTVPIPHVVYIGINKLQ